jgi:tetratricopeptide (TPR) repeat protein
MKKYFFPLLAFSLFVCVASAQKLPKPTQLPNSLTADQQTVLQSGIRFHDAGKFDEAVAMYDKILAENPDATIVIYEKALSLYAKGDKEKRWRPAYSGAKYKSDELALFYSVMANCLDDVGKGAEAIQIYRQAEDMLKSDIGMKAHLASVYYNLGVTYARQNKSLEARTELKKAVQTNYAYASPHYLLSVVFNESKYKVPAFAAAARFVSLEYNTQRGKSAANIVANTLKAAAKNPNTGNINIILDMNAPKDEGDFAMYEMFLGTLTMAKDEKAKKSENELFVDGVGTLIGLLAEDRKLGSTFVGKNYIPFLVEMKKNGYVEPFGYMVLYISGKGGRNDMGLKQTTQSSASFSNGRRRTSLRNSFETEPHMRSGSFLAVFLMLAIGACSIGEERTSNSATNSDAKQLQDLRATIKKIEPFFKPMGKPANYDWLASHNEPGQTFDEYLESNPTLPTAERNTIYVLPLGKFTAAAEKR